MVIPTMENPQPQANATKIQSIIAQFQACRAAFHTAPDAETLWRHSPMSAADATLAQLSEPSFATDQEITLIKIYNSKAQACQQNLLDALSSAMPRLVPPISTSFTERADQVARLEDHEITWGEFNTRLRRSAIELRATIKALTGGGI